MRVGDPKMSISHPHLQTWPPFQASWIPPPLPPQLTGDTFVHNAYLTPSLPPASQAFKCYNNRPSPLSGWPRYCHKKLVRCRMLRLVVVGRVGILLFPTGKDRDLYGHPPHCPPSLPTPTYFPNLPFPVELGELFIDFISD